VLFVSLSAFIRSSSTDQSFNIENRVLGIGSILMLRSISNQSFNPIESNIGRRYAVALVVSQDFDFDICITSTHEYVVLWSLPMTVSGSLLSLRGAW